MNIVLRAVTFVALCVACTHGLVLGLDLGSEWLKVSLVQPGKAFQIVTNLVSKRKTESAMAFYQGERVFESDAANVATKKPHYHFGWARQLLGRGMEHPALTDMRKTEYYKHDLVTMNDTGRLGFIYNKGKDDEKVYRVVEIMAMVLNHVKAITTAYSEGAKPRDIVITVPSYFTQHEREALMDAASISGLKVLSLIDENTAAALQYGIDRTFENKTHNVLYYNLGSSGLQVSVVAYGHYKVKDGAINKTIGSFEVKSKAFDTRLGGHYFDMKVLESLADAFNEKWKKGDVREVPRAVAKLRKQATKTKQTLSANEYIPVYMESLHDDTDFNLQITRKQLEEKSADLLSRLTVPVEQALTDANITKEDIDAVELLGGGVLMPAVQRSLAEFFGENTELGRHLNGDEAMALGAAFYAANISTAFRVRRVGMHDISSFPIGVKFEDSKQDDSDTSDTPAEADSEAEGEKKTWSKRATVFKRRNKLNSRKVVAFQHDSDITCSFHYDDEKSMPPGAQPLIAVYNVSGIADFAKEMNDLLAAKNLTAKPKVSLSFHLDSSSIVKLVKAEASVDEIIPPTPEEMEAYANATAAANQTDAETADASAESDAKSNETTAGGGGNTTANSTAGDESSQSSGKTNSTDSNSTETKEATKKPKKILEPPKNKKKTHRRQLKVVRTDEGMLMRSMDDKERKSSVDMIKAMDLEDAKRAEQAEAKNNLEGYLYSVKDYMASNEEDIEKVSTAEQREEITKEVEYLEEWLYDEGDNLEATEYRLKRSDLKKKVDAISLRVKEFAERPAAVETAQKWLAKTTDETLPAWEKKKPWITATEREEVVNATSKVSAWLNEKLAAQEKVEVHDAPAFKAKDVKNELKALRALVSRLSKRPKPSPKPEPIVINTNSTNATNTSTPTDSTAKVDNSTKVAEDEKVKVEDDEKDQEAKTEEAQTDKQDEL